MTSWIQLPVDDELEHGFSVHASADLDDLDDDYDDFNDDDFDDEFDDDFEEERDDFDYGTEDIEDVDDDFEEE